jgi:hypothetical protein
MAKKTRKFFHSILTKKDGWIVQADKRMVSMHGTQKESERAAIEAGRKEQERGGSGRLCYTNPTVRSAKSARTARTRKRRPDRSVSSRGVAPHREDLLRRIARASRRSEFLSSPRSRINERAWSSVIFA